MKGIVTIFLIGIFTGCSYPNYNGSDGLDACYYYSTSIQNKVLYINAGFKGEYYERLRQCGAAMKERGVIQ